MAPEEPRRRNDDRQTAAGGGARRAARRPAGVLAAIQLGRDTLREVKHCLGVVLGLSSNKAAQVAAVVFVQCHVAGGVVLGGAVLVRAAAQ